MLQETGKVQYFKTGRMTEITGTHNFKLVSNNNITSIQQHFQQMFTVM